MGEEDEGIAGPLHISSDDEEQSLALYRTESVKKDSITVTLFL